MVKFLFVGDLHLRGTNPRNRIDDYKEAAKQKLKEVFKIAVDNAVDAILQPGDIFDRPEVGIAVLLEFAEVLKESPVSIYCTLGNHDIYAVNGEPPTDVLNTKKLSESLCSCIRHHLNYADDEYLLQIAEDGIIRNYSQAEEVVKQLEDQFNTLHSNKTGKAWNGWKGES